MTSLLHLDSAILLWINGFAHHYYWFDHVVVALIGQEFLQGSFFFLALWWLWFRNPEQPLNDRIDVIKIVVTVCLGALLARALQVGLPGRLRPINDPSLGFVLPFTQWPGALEHWSSFPSDHAVVYFALATAIWVRHRVAGAIAYAWFTVFSLLPRVYVGLHYPGDILAGAVIGVVVMRAADAIPVPRVVVSFIDRAACWARHYPTHFYLLAAIGTFEFMSMCDDVRVIGRGVASVMFGAK